MAISSHTDNSMSIPLLVNFAMRTKRSARNSARLTKRTACQASEAAIAQAEATRQEIEALHEDGSLSDDAYKKRMQQVEKKIRKAERAANAAKAQLNIDNTAVPNYTESNNANGGVQSVSGRSFEADSDGISGVYAERDADYQGQRRFDSVPIDSGLVLSAQAQNAIRSRDVDIVETKDVSANSAAFSAALDESRAANAQNGWAVTPKSAQEIAENGTYYVVETVPDTAAKTTYIVSAYMSKKGAKKTAPSSAYGNNAPSVTPEHARRVAVDGTVSQEAADVNPRNEQTLTAAEVEATAQQVRERYETQYGKNMTGAQQAEMYADIAAALDSEQSSLPKGTGAAELGFTGEMTPADQWVAEAQGQAVRILNKLSPKGRLKNISHQKRQD